MANLESALQKAYDQVNTVWEKMNIDQVKLENYELSSNEVNRNYVKYLGETNKVLSSLDSKMQRMNIYVMEPYTWDVYGDYIGSILQAAGCIGRFYEECISEGVNQTKYPYVVYAAYNF
jgi:hypothetical protein